MIVVKTGLVSALVGLTLLGVTASTPAQAGHDGAVAAGVIGGLAAGAIAGSALSNANRGYYDGGYAPAPAYAAPAYSDPAYGGGCYFVRKPVVDEDGEVIGHRRVRVCE